MKHSYPKCTKCSPTSHVSEQYIAINGMDACIQQKPSQRHDSP